MAKLSAALLPVVIAALTAVRSDAQDLRYTVRATTVDVDEAGNIPLDVTMSWQHDGSPRAVLQMPHWTPGSYRLRDFPERVEILDAALSNASDSATRSIPFRELREGRFELRDLGAGEVTVRTRVHLVEADRFMHPGPGRKAITYEGPQVYMYLVGLKDRPSTVVFDLPEGWEAASGLHPTDSEDTFEANDYDFLVDCPVKLGTFRRWQFETDGKPIEVVMDGADDVEFDDEAWIANIQAVTEVQSAMHGGLPFEHYTFLFTASRTGKGGGLEHLTSTAIGARTGSLGPTARLGTIAHEFFHLWNVKRSRPIELGPFDYTRPNRTTMLWLCEGFTSYYTDVTLARMGQFGLGGFWRRMENQIRRLEGTPARTRMSSADASYGVWDETPIYGSISYYNSGEVLGLLLDVQIRAVTDNQKSLDDVMNELYRFCEREGRGFTNAEMRGIVRDVSGTDFDWFFEAHVDGVLTPDYATLLDPAGIDVKVTTTRTQVLDGLGVLFGAEANYPYWSDPAGGRQAIQRSGILVSVDGEAVGDRDSVRNLIRSKAPGSTVSLTLRRADGSEEEVRTELRNEERTAVSLRLREDVDDLATRIRASMIRDPR